MKPQITVITLAVADLEKAFNFYHQGLEFPSEGIIGTEFENGAVAFFDLHNGLKLALWPRRSLAADSGLPLGGPQPTELSVGHNVGSADEVDRVLEQARSAGATVVKLGHTTFWGGYSGYFLDPDSHLWEVVWNPAWETT